MFLIARRLRGWNLPPMLPAKLHDAVVAIVDRRNTELQSGDGGGADCNFHCSAEAHGESFSYSGWASFPRYQWLDDAEKFMRDTDFSRQHHGSILWIPAVCIRWTQDGVNAELRFQDRKLSLQL